MANLWESLKWLATDPLGRRIRGNEPRMFLFQYLESVHQCVILRVGDLGRIQNVVEIFVVSNLFAQLFDLL